MRTLVLPGGAALRLLGLILALTLAAVGRAGAQPCRSLDPPCPPDEPPSMDISPNAGHFSTPLLDVVIHLRDDSDLNSQTFRVTLNGTDVTEGVFALQMRSSAATWGRAVGQIQLQPGIPNTLKARICDDSSQCAIAEATYEYTPPPPPPEKAAPLLNVDALHNPRARVPSAFDAGLGYSTPAYVSLDVPRSVGIAYSSELASPTGFVQVDASPNSATLPDRMSIAILNAAGNPVRLTSRTTENFYGSINGPTRLAAQWDASGLPTGAYTYIVVVRNWWGTQYLETRDTTRVLVVNERQSPIGAGWIVAGLQRLHLQGDGSVVLTHGDGSASFFAVGACTAESCQYQNPPGDFTTLTRVFVRDAAGNLGSEMYRRILVDESVLTYTAEGRLISAEDRFGQRVQYGYAPTGRLTSITDPLGLITTLNYDAAGKLASIRDPGGRTAAVTIDRTGNLVRIADPDGVVALRAHYGPGHRVAQRWDRTGGAYGFDYDRAGKLARTLSPGVVTDSGPVRLEVKTTSWEAALLPGEGMGSLARPAPRVIPDSARAVIRDPKGNTTRIAFDRWGLPARVEDPERKASSWERNEAGQVNRTTDAQGITQTYLWSGPNLIAIGDPALGSHTEIHYKGHKPETVFHNDVVQLVNYYGPTMLLDSARTDTSVTRYTYDTRGRMLSVRDPEGHRSTVEYQSTGMQNTASATAMRGTEPRTTTYTYDALGRVERVSDPAGRVVRTAYDVLNRVIRVTGPDSTVVRYGYDDPARTYTLTDPKGQTYSTVSNALGWVESQTDPRGKVERFTYDRDGNVTRYTNRRLQQVISSYDTLGRILTRTADAKTTRFHYDTARLWVAVENEEGADTLRIDDAGRLAEAIAVRNGQKYVIATGYGDQGLRNTLTVTGPWGTRPIASLGYDNVFRLNYFRAFTEEKAAGLTYTPDQLVERVTLPTGTPTDTTRLRMSFGYTPLHAPAKIGFSRPAVEAALGRSYAHDELERIAVIYRQSALGGQERRVVTYDSLGRIADYTDVRIWESDETVCDPVTPPQLPECHPETVQHVDTLRRESYAYDKADNRTDRGAVVETGNRLTSFDGYTMQYDDDGNLVRKFRLDGSGALAYEQTLAWNSLGQLQSVTTNGSTTTFGYGGWGQRVRKTTGGITTRYLWDGDDLVMELDGAGNPVREYAYYPGIDQPNAMRRGSDGVVFRYTQEQPGHVSGLVGAGNVVVNRYAYTPWGEPLSMQEQVPQPLQYAAREYDAETGLYFVRARYYDPQQGRFVSEDPVGLAGGINPYGYAGGDPANLTDPTGLSPCNELERRQMREIGIREEVINFVCSSHLLPGITAVGRSPFSTPFNQGATNNLGNPLARGGNFPRGGVVGGGISAGGAPGLLPAESDKQPDWGKCGTSVLLFGISAAGDATLWTGAGLAFKGAMAYRAGQVGMRAVATGAVVTGRGAVKRRAAANLSRGAGAMSWGTMEVGYGWAGTGNLIETVVLDVGQEDTGWYTLLPFIGTGFAFADAVSHCYTAAARQW